MRPSRWIGVLFAVLALAACLIPWQEAIAKPVAECKDGKCVMSEEDYKRIKEFWKALRDFSEKQDAKVAEDAKAQYQLMQKLSSCMAILEERKE